MIEQSDICIVSDVNFVKLCFFKGFLVFEIRKNLDLRKILVIPKIFLKSRFHCTGLVAMMQKMQNVTFEN